MSTRRSHPSILSGQFEFGCRWRLYSAALNGTEVSPLTAGRRSTAAQLPLFIVRRIVSFELRSSAHCAVLGAPQYIEPFRLQRRFRNKVRGRRLHRANPCYSTRCPSKAGPSRGRSTRSCTATNPIYHFETDKLSSTSSKVGSPKEIGAGGPLRRTAEQLCQYEVSLNWACLRPSRTLVIADAELEGRMPV